MRERYRLELSGNLEADVDMLFHHADELQNGVYWWDLPEHIRKQCTDVYDQINALISRQNAWLEMIDVGVIKGWDFRELSYINHLDLRDNIPVLARLAQTDRENIFGWIQWVYRVHLDDKRRKEFNQEVRRLMSERLEE